MNKHQTIFGRSYLPISLAIQLRTWCWWSHVGVIDGNDVIESRGGYGVVKTPIEEFKKRYRHIVIKELHVENNNFIEDLNKQIGKKYDSKSFWGIALGLIGWDDIDAYQCAEVVGKYSHNSFNKPLYKLVPKDILKVSHDIK